MQTKPQEGMTKKRIHIKPLWAIMTVLVAAVVAAQVVLIVVGNNMRQDDLDSLVFRSHYQFIKTAHAMDLKADQAQAVILK